MSVLLDAKAILKAYDESLCEWFKTPEGEAWIAKYAVTKEDFLAADEIYRAVQLKRRSSQ